MSKTFPSNAPHLITDPGQPVLMTVGLKNRQPIHWFGILNLGHWDLFEICILMLGISISYAAL
jgi:hypothetical protein